VDANGEPSTITNIPDSPYQSPKEPERTSPLRVGRRSHPGLILAAFVWASLIFFTLPLAAVRGDLPPSFDTKLLTTVITALAILGLALSVTGWRHCLVAPLWIVLILLQYSVWTATDTRKKSDRPNQSARFEGQIRTMKYFSEAKQLWQTYVPKAGQADTVQGELIRAVEKLRDEAQKNGNCNWDRGHEILCSFIRDTLCNSGVFDSAAISEIKSDTARLEDYEHPYCDDDLYDRLTDRIVEWYHKNPDPIAHEHNPDLRR